MRSNILIIFTPGPGMLKTIVSVAKSGVRVDDRIAQRSGAVIVSVRHDKTLSRGSEVCCLIRAQVVEGLTWLDQS